MYMNYFESNPLNIYHLMSATSESLKRLILVLAVTFIVIIILSILFTIDLTRIYGYIDILILATSLSITLFLLKGIRFYMILRYSGYRPSISDAITLRFGSEFFSLIGVSYIGDEVYRIYYLEKMDVDRGIAISISYSEVFMEVLTAFILIIFGSLLTFLDGYINIYLLISLFISILIVIANVLFILGFPIVYRLISRLFIRFGFKSFSDKLVIKDIHLFKEHFHKVILDYKVFPVIMSISILIGLISGMVLYILSIGFIPNPNYILSLLIVYIANTISSLPITVGGLGITEGVIISSLYPVGESTSVIIAILYRLSSYIAPLLISALILNMRIFRRASSVALRRG
ncbi:MAG TPA: flippase-like domain-containing protein [Thermoprotei archaeon]|nr:flippase-like domain-containing protein [Thermoprotei archaeon]